MSPQKPSQRLQELVEQKLLNKTFYRFVFSFIAVIAGVLFFILVLGVGSEV
ncbi:MAG: hypothetical protein KBC62_03990 [Candidatus Pacebacteria bacterium]|jgi:hypothetical protein|nr:hypothetical protein [Candidatus Paceibacterota bacterium]